MCVNSKDMTAEMKAPNASEKKKISFNIYNEVHIISNLISICGNFSTNGMTVS